MDRIERLDVQDFARSTFGTDNGPACFHDACAGSVYRYDIEPGEKPTMRATCIACGAETLMPAPSSMPIDGCATFLRRWHERCAGYMRGAAMAGARIAVSRVL